MTGPALRALKEGQPNRHLTLLTSQAGAAVGRLLPFVDEIMVYDAPWMKATASRLDSQLDYAMIEELRSRHFDGAVIFTVYSQNPVPPVFLCYMADIKLRLAYCHENLYQLLTDWLPDPEPQELIRHEVRRQLDLVGAIGCTTTDERLFIDISPSARQKATAVLDGLGLDREQPWVVLHPGATAASRRYPPTGFAEVARRLNQHWGWQIFFSGTPDERPLVEEIRQSLADVPSNSLVGLVNLAELAALLEQTPLLISNNSGPVHIAAATGTPVVDLYALTNPQHTPWSVPNRVLSHDVPCKYCYKSVCPLVHNNCLRLVTPTQIEEAAVELFEQTRSARFEVGRARS